MNANKPHPPKPLYPMYPEEHKAPKPKRKKEDTGCLCCPKRDKKRINEKAIRLKEKVEWSNLEFWSVFGVPYLLLVQGVFNSLLCPIMGLLYLKDCPALPVLIPVLIAKFPLVFLDGLGMFLLSARAFEWSKSYSWVERITDKVDLKWVSGMLLAFFVLWGTALFNSTTSIYTDDKPVSYDPASHLYCHPTIYRFARITQALILLYIGSLVFLFVIGGTTLLCLLCIASRIRG